MTRKFLSFALVGGIATLCQYVILVILVELASVPAITASAAGFVLSSVLNYRLNYSLTFASGLPHTFAFPRFVTTATVGLGINTGSMFVFVELLAIHYLLAQLLATALTLAWNFSINSIWSFNETARGNSGD